MPRYFFIRIAAVPCGHAVKGDILMRSYVRSILSNENCDCLSENE